MSEKGKFKVVDKRVSLEENEESRVEERVVKDGKESEISGVSSSDEKTVSNVATQQDEASKTSSYTFPQIDFVTFILSLNTQAMCALGILPHPETRKCEVNIPLARQTIDILGMLQEKTKGNLTNEEQKLLDEILYNLRLTFVDKVMKK